jgi:hypothetical protein
MFSDTQIGKVREPFHRFANAQIVHFFERRRQILFAKKISVECACRLQFIFRYNSNFRTAEVKFATRAVSDFLNTVPLEMALAVGAAIDQKLPTLQIAIEDFQLPRRSGIRSVAVGLENSRGQSTLDGPQPIFRHLAAKHDESRFCRCPRLAQQIFEIKISYRSKRL